MMGHRRNKVYHLICRLNFIAKLHLTTVTNGLNNKQSIVKQIAIIMLSVLSVLSSLLLSSVILHVAK